MVGQPFDSADPAEPAGLGDHLDDLILRAEAWAASRRTVVVAAAVVLVAAGVAWWTVARASPSAPVSQPSNPPRAIAIRICQ